VMSRLFYARRRLAKLLISLKKERHCWVHIGTRH